MRGPSLVVQLLGVMRLLEITGFTPVKERTGSRRLVIPMGGLGLAFIDPSSSSGAGACRVLGPSLRCSSDRVLKVFVFWMHFAMLCSPWLLLPHCPGRTSHKRTKRWEKEGP